MEMCPLHEVLKNGHVELAKYLICEGAKVTGKTKVCLLLNETDLKKYSNHVLKLSVEFEIQVPFILFIS